MFKRCKVVKLPTNKKAGAISIGNRSQIAESHIFQFEKSGIYLNHTFYHLYILSDDKIKEGDWCYKKDLKGCIFQWKSTENPWYQDAKKIIATTDKSLFPEETKDCIGWYPQPSQSFIEKYITEYNKGNVITDVLVEYEEFVLENNSSTLFKINRYFTDTCEMTGIKRDAVEYFTDGGLIVRSNIFKNITIVSFPKVNSKDNTITIKKVKDSWTREEVLKLIKVTALVAFVHPEVFAEGVIFDDNKFNKWVEEIL